MDNEMIRIAAMINRSSGLKLFGASVKITIMLKMVYGFAVKVSFKML
jgi:hypothetical protein